jgi:uncharacterized protein (DUF1800 family)
MNAQTAPDDRPMGKVAASRLLAQATFGPTLDTIDAVAALSYEQWFATQASAAPSLCNPSLPNKDVDWTPVWLRNVVHGPDQLRQRMAFALSQILVISSNTAELAAENQSVANYYDILVKGALGNYRTLLEEVTLSPAMGRFLSMWKNNKPDRRTGVHADENYAREIMQLFSIGLVQLKFDGTPLLDSSGREIPTYGQQEVEHLARTFTGWGSKPTKNPFGELSWTYDGDFINPMVAYEDHHDRDPKKILSGVMLPARRSAAADLKVALDTIFNHSNVGPFIGKQLIQRLVTSNPSPAYVERVARTFNDNGKGTRGDLFAVTKAILTDSEATNATGPGKLREPLLRLTNLWRAFEAIDANGGMKEMAAANASNIFQQQVLAAPSVFNFYRPDYMRAGPLARAGLVAPEFQIINENSLVLTHNQLQIQAYQFVDSKGTKHAGPDFDTSMHMVPTNVLLRTAQWEQFAGDPGRLLDAFSLVLMQGQMGAAMKSSLVKYITAIPASAPWSRAIEAVDLIITSAQFAIQR